MRKFLVHALLMVSFCSSGQELVVVTDCNLQGWVKQPTAGTTLMFKNTEGAPLGKGSLEFSSPNVNFVRFRSTSYHGTLLSSITEWGYSTYVRQRTNNRDVNYVVVLIDKNNDGRTDDNLVFDPRFQSAPYIKDGMPDQGLPKVGEWQKWDMLKGGWWLGPPPRPDPDQGGAFFTLQSYIQQNPGARIINDAALGGGGIRLTGGAVVGIFAPDFIGYADEFRIGVNGATKVYDFEFTIANAGSDRNLIYGYGPGCLQVEGKADGGVAPYQYYWTPLNLTTSSIKVCPATTSQYTLTVKDSKGCTGTDDIQVSVTDVRCGSKLNKVRLCHKGEEICVAEEAVESHLGHGDQLGSCIGSNQVANRGEAQFDFHGSFSVRPNPFSGSTLIHYSVPAEADVSLVVFDITGRKVQTLVNGKMSAGAHDIRFNDTGKGVYIAKLEYHSMGRKYSQTLRLLQTH